MKEGGGHSAGGVKKNTEDLGLPSPISAKESVNTLHVKVSRQILFGGERETHVTLLGQVRDAGVTYFLTMTLHRQRKGVRNTY